MAKSIKNKQYTEFWEDEKLEVKKTDDKTNEKVSSDEIKKLEKKLTKKVSGLEKEIKELKEEPKQEIQPVNKPRGWHARNEFIDDDGNKFSKGVFVEKVQVEEKDEETSYVEKTKENIKKLGKERIEKIVENIIPDEVINLVVESDERKMEIPKEIDIEKIKEIEPLSFKNEPQIIKNEPQIIPKKPNILTDKDIYQQYINDDVPFKMFFRGNLIFDSKVQPKRNYPQFNDDGFILFGKNYIYRGIRIEKY